MGHTPGRGHRDKSDPPKKRRFARAARRKKTDADKAHQEAIERWNAMPEEARKLRPELHPDNFKPRKNQ